MERLYIVPDKEAGHLKLWERIFDLMVESII